MPTGDGLLVRLLPVGTIPLAAFAGLCGAAREHGNGVIEITARGSIQIRGLNAASAPRFAAAVASLGIAAQDGVAVLTNPLAGIEAEEIFDATELATALRVRLARGPLARNLAPKISVIVDGGAALCLDEISADVRLKAVATGEGVLLRIVVGGDGISATPLGAVAPAQGVEAVVRLLDVIARHGRDARARDVLKAEGLVPFRAALAIAACSSELPLGGGEREKNDAIGLHRLRDGSLACGIGLAFGHADATAIEQLTNAAGASGMRTAPGRVLMAIGLSEQTARKFTNAAERLGFIVCANDPRRRIVACAGAPICGSAHIAARAMAPSIAAAAPVDAKSTIHISGCAKGCAHPLPAALTIVGTEGGCALIADGTARDTPFAVVPPEGLSKAIASALPRNRDV
jgi:precorrin-3B synthase